MRLELAKPTVQLAVLMTQTGIENAIGPLGVWPMVIPIAAFTARQSFVALSQSEQNVWSLRNNAQRRGVAGRIQVDTLS